MPIFSLIHSLKIAMNDSKYAAMDASMTTFPVQGDKPLDIEGCLVYLKIQINRLGALANYYNVLHLQYDSMPEPARTDLAGIARKIMIVAQHLVDSLGPQHPLSEELCRVINNVGERVTGNEGKVGEPSKA